jgi:hypothetical protein
VVKARNHQSVDWSEYFATIKTQCPWSLASWQRGQIDITQWKGKILPLTCDARIYTVDLTRRRLKKLAKRLSSDAEEWLWSTPYIKPYGTPVACLIQQSRPRLEEIRVKLLKHS